MLSIRIRRKRHSYIQAFHREYRNQIKANNTIDSNVDLISHGDSSIIWARLDPGSRVAAAQLHHSARGFMEEQPFNLQSCQYTGDNVTDLKVWN